MMNIYLTRGRVRLRLRACPLGRDWNLLLSGGHKEHVGAVAVAMPHASRNGEGRSATASVIALPGHKEDLLARRLALHAARTLDVTVSVTCGIHIDAPEAWELDAVDAMADILLNAFLERLPCSEPQEVCL